MRNNPGLGIMVQVIDTIYDLEKLDDIGDLAKLLVFPGQDMRR